MISKEREIAGKIMRLETGKIARQSNGSVVVKYGDSVVFTAVNSAKDVRDDIDFFPLQVEYFDCPLYCYFPAHRIEYLSSKEI